MFTTLFRDRVARLVITALLLSIAVLPFTAMRASAAMTAVSAASSVTGGRNITITVKFNSPAYTGGFLVLMYTSNPLIPVPGTLVIPGGQSQASFTVKTGTTSVDTPVTVTAKNGGISVSKVITVKKPYLYKLAVQPTYPEGTTGYITAKISGPAPSGGVTVYFSSNRPSIMAVPASARIPAGYSSVTVAVKPVMVPYDVALNLSASSSGIKITLPTIVTNGP
jgi:hypothetical protein